MIEVTKRNYKGTINIVSEYEDEKAFGKSWHPNTVEELFRTTHWQITINTNSYWDIEKKEQSYVAYNEKGKILTPEYLIGFCRKHYRWYGYHPRSPHGFVRHKRRQIHGGSGRYPKFIQERRAYYACEDQEEFVPKVRPKRNPCHLDLIDPWEELTKSGNYNHNWKRYRKHQWREK